MAQLTWRDSARRILVAGSAAAVLGAGGAMAPLALSAANAGPLGVDRVTLSPAAPAVSNTGSPGTAFSCATPTIFLAQASPTQLYDSLYGAGSTSFAKIGTTHGWNYNGIGYDPSNKYLYGVSVPSTSKSYPAGHLLEIGSTGSVDDLGAITGDSYLTTYGANNGAFNGSDFWVTSPGDTVADEVSLGSKPAVVHKVTITPAKSWHPVDFTSDAGFMWGMATNAGHVYMYRLNLTSGAVSTFAAPSGVALSASYGAAWTYGNGNLGFDANTTGALYQISVTDATSSKPTFALVSSYTGPVTNSSDDGAACVPTPVDLGIVKTGPASTIASSKITWTLKVTNHGPGISSGYVVNDTVPAGVTHVASTSPGCKVSGNVLTCTEGKLTVDAAATFTVTGDAPTTAGSCITNTATVIGNEHDPTPSNNTSSVKTCTTKASPTLGSETPTPATGIQGTSFADKVTVSGGSGPTGTLTFNLFGPAQSTCSGTPQATVTTTVHGDGTYTSPGVYLSTVGNYWWVASYGGDGNNNGSATACADGLFSVTTAPPGSCTIDWAGPTSGGLWATPADWNLGRVPTAGDVVCIGSAGSSFSGPVVFDGSNGTSDTSIAQIKSYAPLEITGGELAISDTSSSAVQQSFVTGLTLAGGQLGDETNMMAAITDNGALEWTSGSFLAPTAESPQPVITQTGGAADVIDDPDYLDNWNLSLDGSLSIAGSFYFENGGGLTASGAVTIAGGST
ncbi:MAG: hypothetical protein ABSH30_18555, partial [Acidimicrobiales bacterium]